MKYLCVFILTAGLTFPADFKTGEAARLMIGQRTFTDQNPGNDGPTASLLGAVSGVTYAAGKLFVVDSNPIGATPLNHRVLVFDTSQLPQPMDIINREQSDNKRCPVCVGTASVVLGQSDFTKRDLGLSQNQLRSPVGIASDGTRVVVADTDNNRVLIWNTIPATNGANADVVLGQPDFKSNGALRPPTAQSMRGPQGVWIQNGKLYVADTQNHRVLIWNSIPTSNGQAADVVLGQPSFTSAIEPDITKAELNAQANTLLSPVSVTSDGMRLYVTDLGYNRVLIWNSLPTQNQQAADVAVGQPDMVSAIANNSSKLCEALKDSDGNPLKDSSGNTVYPALCAATVDFPRYALSDGQRLFIADGGNDRVLVYNSIPTASGTAADTILGQFSATYNAASDNADPLRRSSSDSIRTPMSLAWDGTNLYTSDPFNRRVLVFTLAEPTIPFTGVRNAASLQVFAVGAITLSGQMQKDDQVTIKIGDKEYSYKIVDGDTFAGVVSKLVLLINDGKGDPNVLATPNIAFATIILTARQQGDVGNSISFSATVTPTTGAKIFATTSGATLSGGQDAAKIAPGTLVSILGDNLTDQTASAPPDAERLPTVLGGVRVYIDGIESPLLYVSPSQINAQVPWETLDASSLSTYVRTEWSDGRVTISNPAAVPMIAQNPGLFATGGEDPRPGVVLHYSSNATGTVSVDGTPKANDVLTVKIGPSDSGIITIGGVAQTGDVLTVKIGPSDTPRTYTYTVKDGDTLDSIRDALVTAINADTDIVASAASTTTATRIRLKAKKPGELAGGAQYWAEVSAGAAATLAPSVPQVCCVEGARSYSYTVKDGDTITVIRDALIDAISQDPQVEAFPAAVFGTDNTISTTRIRLRARAPGEAGDGIPYSTDVSSAASITLTATTPDLCCANVGSSMVTESNPALPGETIIVYGTGLGLIKPDAARETIVTGGKYTGPAFNEPVEFVSSLAGGKTANVLFAGLMPGMVGVYEIHLELNSDLPSNPLTQLTIAQDIYVSNIITLAVVNPNAPAPTP